MSIDLCRKCRKALGKMDIVLCEECLDEWSTWYKENAYKHSREKLREIRKTWIEKGESLP